MEIDGAFYLVMDAETIEEQLRIIAEIDAALNNLDFVGGRKL